MYYQDALKLLGVTVSPVTLDDVKKAYRAAAMKFHPDTNKGGHEMMQIVNAAYESLQAESYPLNVERKSYYQDDLPSELVNVLNSIVGMEKGTIEICGFWIWLHDLKKSDIAERGILKDLGFKWSAKKKAWYYAPKNDRKRRWGKRSYSMNDIRGFHGSRYIEKQSRKKIS